MRNNIFPLLEDMHMLNVTQTGLKIPWFGPGFYGQAQSPKTSEGPAQIEFFFTVEGP